MDGRFLFGLVAAIALTSMAVSLRAIAKAIGNDRCDCSEDKQENFFMFIVDATNPDVRWGVNLGEIQDAEGNVVQPDQVLVEVRSDNPTAVEVTPDDPSNLAGNTHFGAPGQANVTAIVRDKDEPEQILAAFGAQFLIVAGNPERIVGGGFTFEGLTEEPGEESGSEG